MKEAQGFLAFKKITSKNRYEKVTESKDQH